MGFDLLCPSETYIAQACPLSVFQLRAKLVISELREELFIKFRKHVPQLSIINMHAEMINCARLITTHTHLMKI